ncbi:MAG TPA: DNA polymerase III subunit gamma and tau [Candidatus Nanopelagicales bacterium]
MALALYRTYRPGSLGEVIGQEHVTEPLARALAAGSVHHAYLLSGPRGCGKTSTARILARSLNCEHGPTATPCGTCRSCVELAPNGPGSIDVVELDAATHRGIDDARDLRERAIYAPAASRYKVYIIDEAHQLTNEAANALLKLIEEPPAHLRFIFATTEPDKIISTIRSRTFHYGFRLVPARTLAAHLGVVCGAEGVPAEPAALALVARAGQGSVRDSLSVLGQLLAGAGPLGLTYADAVAALGLTDAALLDDFVAALSAGSAAQMFAVVDRVISGGHDPRRFVTDVLDRLRDLIILRADPEALASGLVEVPDDEGERMASQAQSLGLAELSQAADLVSSGLGELKGATAPRLQLELLCARLALPRPSEDLGALVARIERLERHGAPGVPDGGGQGGPGRAAAPAGPSGSGSPVGARPADAQAAAADAPPGGAGAGRSAGTSPRASAAVPPPAPPAGRTPPTRPTLRTAPAGDRAVATHDGGSVPTPGPDSFDLAAAAPPMQEAPGSAAPQPATPAREGKGETAGASAEDPPAAQAVRGPTEATQERASAPAAAGHPAAPARAGNDDTGLAQVRAGWEQVLVRLSTESRVAWTAFLDAVPLSVANGALAVAVPGAGNLRAIAQRGHDERLRQALIDVLGLDLQIDVVHDPGAAQAGGAGARASVGSDAAGSSNAARVEAPSAAPEGASLPAGDQADADLAAPGEGAAAQQSRPARRVPEGSAHGPRAAARGSALVRGAAAGGQEVERPDEPSEDDPDLSAVDGLALVTRELGARPIGEIDHT